MACLITAGRKIPCSEFVGGLYKIWFANFGITATSTDNVITNLNSGLTVYEYELKGTSKLQEDMVSANGSTSVSQILTVDLTGNDAVLANEVKLLAYGRPHIFVQDNYGNVKMVGRVLGAQVTTATFDSGAAMTDKYGYTITFNAMEKEYAQFLSGSTMASAFAGMTNQPTIVKGA